MGTQNGFDNHGHMGGALLFRVGAHVGGRLGVVVAGYRFLGSFFSGLVPMLGGGGALRGCVCRVPFFGACLMYLLSVSFL